MQTKFHDVTAIITAMTDGERPFVRPCFEAVSAEPEVAEIFLCVQDRNDWIETALGVLLEDPRCRVVGLPLAPPGAIRNAAVGLARMPWVAFCDGDDLWCRGKTRAQRTWAERFQCDMIGADHYLCDEGGTIRAVALARYLPMLSSWMVRTEVMRKYPFKENVELTGVEDSEWWFRTRGVVVKRRCPRLLLRYRVRRGTISDKEPSKQRKARIVAAGSKPFVGGVVLVLTWCLWMAFRRTKYAPLEK